MKRAYFYIDDVIWCLRDIARNKPQSLFDAPFFAMLKKAHEDSGLKIQLNLFYRTDYFYGMDEFTLAEVPDTYKKEFEKSSDWLKFSVHAKQEFPDYPFVNATYDDVKLLFETIRNEVYRFAGEKSFTYGVTPHWGPISEDGVRALYDCGVRVLWASWGDKYEYNGDPASLPYGHALRLLNNRQPDAMLYSRGSRDVAIDNSICCTNHLTPEQALATRDDHSYVVHEKTGMKLKRFGSVNALNLIPLDELEEEMKPMLNNEFFCGATHEQYFFEDYFAYQPDYAEKLYKCAALLKENGYDHGFLGDVGEM